MSEKENKTKKPSKRAVRKKDVLAFFDTEATVARDDRDDREEDEMEEVQESVPPLIDGQVLMKELRERVLKIVVKDQNDTLYVRGKYAYERLDVSSLKPRVKEWYDGDTQVLKTANYSAYLYDFLDSKLLEIIKNIKLDPREVPTIPISDVQDVVVMHNAYYICIPQEEGQQRLLTEPAFFPTSMVLEKRLTKGVDYYGPEELERGPVELARRKNDINNVFEEILGESVEEVLSFFAASLAGRPLKKFLNIWGPKNTGKSTIANMTLKLPGLVEIMNAHDLQNRSRAGVQYQYPYFDGFCNKRLLIINETEKIPFQLDHMQKVVSGGDVVSYTPKSQGRAQKPKTGVIRGKLVVFSNDPIVVDNVDFNRVCRLSCKTENIFEDTAEQRDRIQRIVEDPAYDLALLEVIMARLPPQGITPQFPTLSKNGVEDSKVATIISLEDRVRKILRTTYPVPSRGHYSCPEENVQNSLRHMLGEEYEKNYPKCMGTVKSYFKSNGCLQVKNVEYKIVYQKFAQPKRLKDNNDDMDLEKGVGSLGV